MCDCSKSRTDREAFTQNAARTVLGVKVRTTDPHSTDRAPLAEGRRVGRNRARTTLVQRQRYDSNEEESLHWHGMPMRGNGSGLTEKRLQQIHHQKHPGRPLGRENRTHAFNLHSNHVHYREVSTTQTRPLHRRSKLIVLNCIISASCIVLGY